MTVSEENSREDKAEFKKKIDFMPLTFQKLYVSGVWV